MRLKAATVFALGAVLSSAAIAQEASASAGSPKEDPEMESEIAYVEALVNAGYPDLTGPLIERTKKKWPASEARFFAIEIRGLLSLGKFEEAEKAIAALPDRKSTKYWAARLEVANNYFARGKKEECMKIYGEFFKVFPKPPREIRKFYIEACYSFGQLLAGDGQYAKAAERYEALLKELSDDEWCNLACETCDLYLKLIDSTTDPKQKKVRDGYIAAATKLVDQVLWNLDKPVYFGRAVSMKAHLALLTGDVARASEIIEDYRPQLKELHDQIVQVDPDGKGGLLRLSPLPECMFMQAKMLWGEAQAEYKKPKRDEEKVKVCMFGPKGKNGKRDFSKGAFAMAQNVFLNYETSSWAAQSGDLAQEIVAFTKEKYGKEVKCKITPEQIAKVRKAQFTGAAELFVAGELQKAIDAYLAVLAKYPEYLESITAVENVASAYLDLIVEAKSGAEKESLRCDADAVEAYLAERFCESKDKAIMVAAGDAVVRLAAKEAERKEVARADRLYAEFCANYTRHTSAANIAASRAAEHQKAERYAEAMKFWQIIYTTYTNASVYATSLAMMSECCGKTGDAEGEVSWIKRYIDVEDVKVRRIQAQMQLAQMYQKRGIAMLKEATTNETPEAVAAAEKDACGTLKLAIDAFGSLRKDIKAAMADPATTAKDKEKYVFLDEAAAFLLAESWGRMNQPPEALAENRTNAAKCYEAYLEAYPAGTYAKNAYVRLGTVYTVLGDMAKSKDAFDRLAKKFPDSDEAKNAKPKLAKSLIEMGMVKEGAEVYAEMLRTDANYTPVQFLNAGDALTEVRNWSLANQAYEKAIRLAGTDLKDAKVRGIVARARLGIAKVSWKQGSLLEAREALDRFLGDANMSKMAIAADANFMLVEVASELGRTEKDETARNKCFGAAIAALKKVRQYWKNKPAWEQASLGLMSGDVLVNRMKAEEAMGLKAEALDSCGRAAATFQAFLQANGPSEANPLDKMDPGAVANVERAYTSIVPLFSKMGAEQAERVLKYGQEYLDLFPNGKGRADIENCMNRARADLPSSAK